MATIATFAPRAVNPVRKLKRTAKFLVRAVSNGWCTADRITGDLQALGVRRGGTLLVHSSLSSLGFVPGGAKTVISALLAAIGPEGTLAMPSHTWERSGRGDFTFELRTTPSCVGAISEAFRTLPGVVRSLHPTHSVAVIGPRARYLIAGHELASTPCGKGTPYAKLIEERCQILFLGVTLDQNTMFHTFEAYAQLPYLMRSEDEAFTVTDAHGTTRTMRFRRHNRGPNRRFAATQDVFTAWAILRKGKVGAGESLLVEGAPMAELVLDRLQEDPNFLVE